MAQNNALLRLAVLVCIALTGLATTLIFGWRGLEYSLGYILLASALLCFGLYMAVYGIDREEAKRHWRIVAIAVTIGVLCKYLLIFGATYLITGDWRYAVLGMAVAQIDPLSVAALSKDQRLSPKTRTILNMWASFDDPMTAIATPFILGATASMTHQQLASGATTTGVLFSLTPFFAALILLLMIFLKRRHNLNVGSRITKRLKRSEAAQTSFVALVGAIAIPFRLYSLAALAGWFVRPAWLAKGRRAEYSLDVALYGATFLLGILLSGGVDWVGGLALGVATYISQIVVAWLVMWFAATTNKSARDHADHPSKRDTWHLALSQQNGITAIVLALNLEPLIPGAVAVVGLAIVVVNTLHFTVNWLFDRHFDRRF